MSERESESGDTLVWWYELRAPDGRFVAAFATRESALRAVRGSDARIERVEHPRSTRDGDAL